jgi:hypothetical protein
MPRKLETREFLINTLRAIARDRKVSAATRVRAIDRIAVLCKFYDFKMEDQSPRDNGSKPEEVPLNTELDRQVAEMLKRHKGETNAHYLSQR